MAKVSRNQLMEMIRVLVKEALDEAGPVGYLSKTQRPDAKTMWNPDTQKQWVAGKTDPSSPGKPATATSRPTGPTGTVVTTYGKEPDETIDGVDAAPEKTIAGVPTAKAGSKPVAQAAPPPMSSGAQQNSLADMSSMLQNASQEQIAQIMRILKGS